MFSFHSRLYSSYNTIVSVLHLRTKRSLSSPFASKDLTGRLPFFSRRSMRLGMATLMAVSTCDDSYSPCARQSITSKQSLRVSRCSFSHSTDLLIAMTESNCTGLNLSSISETAVPYRETENAEESALREAACASPKMTSLFKTLKRSIKILARVALLPPHSCSRAQDVGAFINDSR